jgi:hypothetical protein
VYPLEPRSGACKVGEDEVVFGLGKSTASSMATLTSEADFLFATPHSNGINMGLGSVVLCALEDRPTGDGVPDRVLPCFSGAPCERQRPHNVLVAPSSLRSTVAFLYTCFGVLFSDGTYDVTTSLATSFVSSPYTAALMTTPALSLLDRAGGPFVSDMLRAGTPLGVASATFNARHSERYHDTEDVSVVFGDPEFRLPSAGPPLSPRLKEDPKFAQFASETGLRWYSVASSPCEEQIGSARTAEAATATTATTPTAIAEAAYSALEYARCVVAGTRQLRRPELEEPVGQLADKVDALWPLLMAIDARLTRSDAATLPARLVLQRERQTARLQAAWLDYFVALVSTLGGYLRLQTDQYHLASLGSERDVECPYCGAPAAKSAVVRAGARTADRVLLECVSCATVLDAIAPVTHGEILGEGTVRAGKLLRLSLQIDRQTVDSVTAEPLAAIAVLEPFNKPAGSAPPQARELGSVEPAETSVAVAMAPIAVPGDLAPGVYFVDALVLVGVAPAVLRRSIVVRPSGEGNDEDS